MFMFIIFIFILPSIPQFVAIRYRKKDPRWRSKRLSTKVSDQILLFCLFALWLSHHKSPTFIEEKLRSWKWAQYELHLLHGSHAIHFLSAQFCSFYQCQIFSDHWNRLKMELKCQSRSQNFSSIKVSIFDYFVYNGFCSVSRWIMFLFFRQDWHCCCTSFLCFCYINEMFSRRQYLFLSLSSEIDYFSPSLCRLIVSFLWIKPQIKELYAIILKWNLCSYFFFIP